MAETQNTLEKEQQRRKELAQDVEPGVLREYTKLLNLRNGVAISAVEEDSVCTGCHVALTLKCLQKLKPAIISIVARSAFDSFIGRSIKSNRKTCNFSRMR